jgi:hypothetical protein
MKNWRWFSAERTTPSHLPKVGTAGTKVDGHVEDLALHHAHELGLRVVDLEVKATQDALRGGGLVVLDELDVDATGHEVGALVGLHEVAARVAVRLGVDDGHALDRGGREGEVTCWQWLRT